MIDLHSHILPGLDDGAQNMEDSLNLARKAVSQGITHLLCTPHHYNGKYVNHKYDVIEAVAKLQKELDLRKIPLTLFEGQEVRVNGDLINEIDADDILFCDVKDQYLLIEFPTAEAPSYALRLLEELRSRGITPIIVHPERNGTFRDDPNKLIDYLDIGCLAQLTAPSIIGVFGKNIQKTAEQMIDHGLIQMVASDAHHIQKRTFYMKEAFRRISKIYGKDISDNYETVARSIINGDSVVVPAYSKIKGNKLFGLL